jgi:hypothetical protein
LLKKKPSRTQKKCVIANEKPSCTQKKLVNANKKSSRTQKKCFIPKNMGLFHVEKSILVNEK